VTRLILRTLTLGLGLALPGFGASVAAAAQPPSRSQTIERPSIMQTQDRAHRGQAISLAPASPSTPSVTDTVRPRLRTNASGSGYNSAGLQHEVLGFATYWELANGDLSDVQWDKVSTVAYFGLTLNISGGFDSDSGMTGWNSAALTSLIGNAHRSGDRAVVVIKSFSDASINPVVSNSSTGQTAIDNIIAAVKAKGLDGVNIDFEGSTDSAYPNIQTDFTNWVAKLSSQLHAKVPGSFLTLDAYSGSASWSGGFMRIDTLAPFVDAFFIMAYDMNFPNTLPNAPLAGPYTYTDTTSVDQYLTKVSGDGTKVILGVPYYGYKFSTSNNSFNAPRVGGSVTPTYADILFDINCSTGPPDSVQRHWDTPSSTPWLSWFSPPSGDPCGGNHNSWRETYYDDAASLGAKYDLVNSRGIRGSGIWALGYDHGSTDLWQAIAAKYSAVGPSRVHGNQAVGRNTDGRIELFALNVDLSVWHNWQIAPNSGWWSWTPMGGHFVSDPAVASNADGRLEVFALGSDRVVWHSWQTGQAGGWSGWVPLGDSVTSQPTVARNADGRLEVFVVAPDGTLHHTWQTGPNGNWSGWASLGGAMAGSPAVGPNADGRLQVFVRSPVGDVVTTWQTAPNGNWGGWLSLAGSSVDDVSSAINADGRLEIFTRAGDNSVLHAWQTAANGNWSGWASLAQSILGRPGLGRNLDGRLSLLARRSTGAVWGVSQTTPNGNWAAWLNVGGSVSGSPIIGQNADGRLEAFSRGMDGAAWHTWQAVPSADWGSWQSLGGSPAY
jgi:hypothetical protein